MIADRLRAAVLQAAISGKLTKQFPEDGTARELLEQIAAERTQRVKDKKLKKPKPLLPIADDDRPYPLPTSWEWVRLGQIAECGGGATPKGVVEAMSSVPDSIPFFRVSAMNILGNERELIEPSSWIGNQTKARTPHPSVVFPKNGGAVFTNKRRKLLIEGLVDLNTGYVYPIVADLDYVLHWFMSVDLATVSTGSALPTVNAGIIGNLAFPLPPLAEQDRIVTKLEEVLPLIDQLAELEREREHLDREFAQAIERAILQAAISGKLTKQLPEDGTATELLEQIAAERALLVKEGKLKKQKPPAPMEKVDEPFKLPDNWKWARLGELFSVKSGKATTLQSRSQRYFVPVYGGNGVAGYTEDATVPGGTLLIGRVGFYCGCVHVTENAAWVSDNALELTMHYNAMPVHFWRLQLSYLDLGQTSVSTAQPVVSGRRMYPVPVAVPPVDEQERIVARLDQSLPLVHEIKGLVS